MSLVFIMGMHRSGTSMLTNLLADVGFSVGDSDSLLASHAYDNAKGYWENKHVVALNEEILALLGGTWRNVPQFPENWFDQSQFKPFVYRMRGIYPDGQQNWVVKDPRNSLTYGLWQRAFPQMKVIICVRNPIEVAHSMGHQMVAGRDIPLEEAFSLWETYYEQTLKHIEAENVLWVHYEALLYNPLQEMKRILNYISFEISTIQLESSINVIDLSLKHQAYPHEVVHGDYPSASIAQYYSYMCTVGGNTFQEYLSDTEKSYERVKKYLQTSVREQIQGFEETSKQQAAILKRQQDELAKRDAQIAAQHTELTQLHTHLQQLQDELAKRHLLIEQQQNELAKRDAQIETQQTELTQHHTHLQQLQDELAKRHLLIEQQQDELAKRDAQIETQQTELTQLHTHLQQLQDELAKRHLFIEQQQNELAKRDTQIETQQTELTQHHTHLQQQQEELAKHHILIEQQQNELAKHDVLYQKYQEELAEYNLFLQIKQENLEQLDTALREKQQQLSLYDIKLREHEDELGKRDTIISQKNFELARYKILIKRKTAKISRLSEGLIQQEQMLQQQQQKLQNNSTELLNEQHMYERKIAQVELLIKRHYGRLLPQILDAFVFRAKIRKSIRIIKASQLFDEKWYLQQYPDVAVAGMNPIEHYVRYGMLEGRNPNPHFDTLDYLRYNLDVLRSGMNPFVHYIRFGQKEGRVTHTYPVQDNQLLSLPKIEKNDILIITPDTLGEVRIGLGMRHWEIAKALSSQGYDVTLATPHTIMDKISGDGFQLCGNAENKDIENLTRTHKVIMVQGDIMMRYPSLQKKEAKIIVDMITPIHIEDLSKSQEQFLNTYQNLIRHNLSYGDFFICGNERQRLYWLGILTELGRINQRDTNFHQEMRHLIDVVGFGISEQPPVKPQKSVLKGVLPSIQPDDFLLIWFGGIWEWLEPFPLVRAVHAAHMENPRIKLYFSATRRPNGDIPQKAQATIALAESLNARNTSVFFRDYPVPYHERDAYLLEADLGVLCQAANFETQLSARTRILDHIWAGLPTLINPGDETAELIQRYNLGTVIPDLELNTIKDAILELADNRATLTQKADNVARIQSKFYWTKIIEPLQKFIN